MNVQVNSLVDPQLFPAASDRALTQEQGPAFEAVPVGCNCTPGDDLPESWASSPSSRTDSPDPSTSCDSSQTDSSVTVSLHVAADKGDIHEMIEALRTTQDGNERNDLGETPLVVAAMADQLEALNFLVNHGVNVNLPCGDGKTALMWAATHGNAQAAQVLLIAGAAPNAQDAEGWTAIMLACNEGHEHMVAGLIEHQADINMQNHERRTVLSLAAEASPEICMLLLSEPILSLLSEDSFSSCDITARNPLHYAIINNQSEVAEALTSSKADINATASAMIKDVMFGGELYNGDGVAMIDKMTALMYAAHNDDSESVKLLLAAGMNPNAQTLRKITPLMFASTRGDAVSVNMLLRHKADPNVQEMHMGMTALMFAAGLGTALGGDECVQALCDAGSIIDTQDNMGFTARDWARQKGHESVVKLLQYEGFSRLGDSSYYSGLCRRSQEGAAQCCNETFNMHTCCGVSGRGVQMKSAKTKKQKRKDLPGPRACNRDSCDVCTLQ